MSAPSILELEPAASACCADETWKPVPDWPHESSTCGRVCRVPWLDGDGCLHLGGILALCPDKREGKGYLYVYLRDGKRRRKAPVAHVVLEAHDKPKPGPEYEACHGNDIRTDNHWRNLEWDTKAANLARMWDLRRQRQAVTTLVTTGPETGLSRYRSQVRRGGASSGGVVTAARYGDGPHGTGSFPIPFTFSSVFTSVRPAFRSLRNRKAA